MRSATLWNKWGALWTARPVYTASFIQLLVTQGYRDDQALYLESDTDEQLLIHIPFNQGVHFNFYCSCMLASSCLLAWLAQSLSHIKSLTKHLTLLTCLLHAAVKLNSLVIKSSETEGKGPKRIRLFKNTPSIGFGEAENAPAIQEFDLTEKDLEGEALTLRSTSFCSALHATHRSAHSNQHVFAMYCRFVKFQSLTCLSIFVASNQGDEDNTRVHKIAIFGQSGETMNVADIKKAGEEDKWPPVWAHQCSNTDAEQLCPKLCTKLWCSCHPSGWESSNARYLSEGLCAKSYSLLCAEHYRFI